MAVEKKTESIFDFNKEKIALLKSTICRGASNDELQLFIHACQRTGLDPFMRQIHAVKRFDSSLRREIITIQTGIDGYRLIAERTQRYAPGREPVFTYDENKQLINCTAYVKKQTADGTWHEVSATAFFSEYVALGRDGSPSLMWRTKPHIMLSKCAEALALRRAFPAELSGLYTFEEMQQADNPVSLAKRVSQGSEPAAEPAEELQEEDAQEREDKIREFISHFPAIEGFDLASDEQWGYILDYFTKYCAYWKKTTEAALLYYADKGRFIKDFTKWKEKEKAKVKRERKEKEIA